MRPLVPERSRLRARFGELRVRTSGNGRRALFELVLAATTVALLLPLFAARYLPIQDLPQHAAAVRVLRDYGDPSWRFHEFFELTLSSTQYLSVYVLADVLSYVVGVVPALKLVMAGALIGLPYSLRALLRELGRPEEYALLALPLAYSAELVLGFLNFVAAVPLMLGGLALAVRLTSPASRRTAIALGATALVCFYTHVVPYAVFVAGALLLCSNGGLDRLRRVLVPLLPSFGSVAVWLFTAPSGRAVREMGAEGSRTVFLSLDEALRELPQWFTDVLRGTEDELVFVGWCLLVSTLFAVRGPSAGPFHRTEARRLAWLVPATWLAYFVLPASYSFIWPINGRFPLLAALLCIPCLPASSVRARGVVQLLCVALSGFESYHVFSAFRRAGVEEYAGLPELIARIPRGSSVAGLMFEPTSRYVRFAPYLHSVAWVQAEQGGRVMFSFADFPASPFHFREENRPPRVPPRWEWLPQRVDTERELRAYDYVLSRGAPPTLPGWTALEREGAWALWRPAMGTSSSSIR